MQDKIDFDRSVVAFFKDVQYFLKTRKDIAVQECEKRSIDTTLEKLAKIFLDYKHLCGRSMRTQKNLNIFSAGFIREGNSDASCYYAFLAVMDAIDVFYKDVSNIESANKLQIAIRNWNIQKQDSIFARMKMRFVHPSEFMVKQR